MSANLNLLNPGMPFASYVFNDNVECAQTNIQQQLGVGVVWGMALSISASMVLAIAPGYVQNPRTVYYPGGTYTVPSNGTWYVMANWVAGTPDPVTGLSPYTFSFSVQSSPTPPGGQVCLGQVVASGGALVSISTAGLVVLPHVSGSQFVVGQNRIVSDDSTGVTSVQSLKAMSSQKNILQSGDNFQIAAGYQSYFFYELIVNAGAILTSSGQLRVNT